MSRFVVIKFDNEEEAGQVRDALRKAQRDGNISLDDSAVVIKDAKGKIHVQGQVDRGVKMGAVGGGVVGLLLGSVFFPLAGIAIGVAGGALVGKMSDMGIDKKFVDDVKAAMTPGTSALFVIVREADPTVALAMLRPYKGEVFQTSLDADVEESLRRVLSDRT